MSASNNLKSDIQMLYESPEVLMVRGRELRSQMIFEMLVQIVSQIKKLSRKGSHLRVTFFRRPVNM